jgi:hypothetical protein
MRWTRYMIDDVASLSIFIFSIMACSTVEQAVIKDSLCDGGALIIENFANPTNIEYASDQDKMLIMCKLM